MHRYSFIVLFPGRGKRLSRAPGFNLVSRTVHQVVGRNVGADFLQTGSDRAQINTSAELSTEAQKQIAQILGGELKEVKLKEASNDKRK